MKPDQDYYIDKDNLLLELNELDFISNFILYNKFNLTKKKLKKKLKKLISFIKEDKIDKYLKNSEDIQNE